MIFSEKISFAEESKMNNIWSQRLPGSRLVRLGAVASLVIGIMLFFNFSGSLPSPSTHFTSSSHGSARRIPPQDLLSRPLPHRLDSVPKLIHQSWKDEHLPHKFERWSSTCRQQHPDWEYVLWTDDDNEALVAKYFPWFLETYNALPTVINRADVARNMYMYIFGGVYADLDTECLRPMDRLFEGYGTGVLEHSQTITPLASSIMQSNRTLFLGRMGLDDGFSQSLPNAWLGSTPGHPFWLMALEKVAAAETDRNGEFRMPEELTGPSVLHDLSGKYFDTDDLKGDKLEASLSRNPTLLATFGKRPDLDHAVVILPPYQVYPFSWANDGKLVKEFCEVNQAHFDPKHCKELTAVEHWPSYTITYWSHSWGEQEGHRESSMDILNKDEGKTGSDAA